jgi:acyl-CoA thioester hydrolase
MNALPKLADFPAQTYDKLRFGDTDRLGHVNNAVFVTLLETGRVSVIDVAAGPQRNSGVHFVIANLNLDYRAELFWPGTVEIGSALTAIGNSSMRFTQALFQNEKCVATAQSVLVQIDSKTNRPAPISDATRAALAAFMVES